MIHQPRLEVVIVADSTTFAERSFQFPMIFMGKKLFFWSSVAHFFIITFAVHLRRTGKRLVPPHKSEGS